MVANWIHVMVVHLVVIGTPWLVYRVIAHRNRPLDDRSWKGTYTGLIIVGAIAAIAYFTGPEAAEWTKQTLDSYSQDHVEDHALWARVAFVVQVISSLVGIMGWASVLQEEAPDRRIPYILYSLLIPNTLIIVYAAHLGGLIRRMDLLL